MKRSRFTDSQIIAILKQTQAGTPVPELCREHGISRARFYKWRAKSGGMDAARVSRRKKHEDENRRLKKSYAEAQLKSEIIQEAMARPSDRKPMAQHAVTFQGVSVRLTCQIVAISECCYRYKRVLHRENQLMLTGLFGSRTVRIRAVLPVVT